MEKALKKKKIFGLEFINSRPNYLVSSFFDFKENCIEDYNINENKTSKKLIVELLKENEKIKLEKQMMTNQILESENKELLEQLKGSNEGNKPPVKFLIIFATIFMLATIGLTSIVASIYNRIMYRPARA